MILRKNKIKEMSVYHQSIKKFNQDVNNHHHLDNNNNLDNKFHHRKINILTFHFLEVNHLNKVYHISKENNKKRNKNNKC